MNRRIGIKKTGLIALFLLLLALSIQVLDMIHIPLSMDEIPILYNVAYFVKHKTIIPSHFSYPTFYSYLVSIPVGIGFLIDYLNLGFPFEGLSNSQWMSLIFKSRMDSFVFGGRVVSICLSLSTILLVYLWGKKNYGFVSGITAGLILSFDIAGGRYLAFSRSALPDITATFFATLFMTLCLNTVRSGSTKDLTAAAFFLGMGINTKYNVGMGIFPLVVTMLIKPEVRQLRKVLFIGLFLILGFFVASPGWFIVPQKYIEGFLFESRHMTTGHLGAHNVDWIWVFQYLWKCKTLILPLILVTILFSIYSHKRSDIIFLMLVIPSFIVIGQFEKKTIHYFLFLYPSLALFIGRMVSYFWQMLKSQSGKIIFFMVYLILFIMNPFFQISKMVKRDLTINNIELAEKWISGNLPSNSRVLIDRVLLPNLMDEQEAQQNIESLKEAGSPYWMEAEKYYQSQILFHLYNIRDVWEDSTALSTCQADYIIVSSFNYSRYFIKDDQRLPEVSSSFYTIYNQRKGFYHNLFLEEGHPFRLMKKFTSPSVPRIRIYKRVL